MIIIKNINLLKKTVQNALKKLNEIERKEVLDYLNKNKIDPSMILIYKNFEEWIEEWIFCFGGYELSLEFEEQKRKKLMKKFKKNANTKYNQLNENGTIFKLSTNKIIRICN